MLRFTTSKRCLQFFLQNRIPVRGNPHILVVGDPGLGKSQVIGIDAGLINLLSHIFYTDLFPLKFEMSAWYFVKLKAGFHQCWSWRRSEAQSYKIKENQNEYDSVAYIIVYANVTIKLLESKFSLKLRLKVKSVNGYLFQIQGFSGKVNSSLQEGCLKISNLSHKYKVCITFESVKM